MSTNKYTIAFAGVESYDLILYTAKTLVGLGESVLVSDCSTDGSLTSCFPMIEEWGPVSEIDSVQFVKGFPTSAEKYNWVLVYTGKSVQQFDNRFDEVYLVTDYQKHNVDWLSQCTIPQDAYLCVVLRDRLSSKITAQSLVAKLSHLGLTEEDVIALADTGDDLEAKLLCQYNAKFNFAKVSQSIKEFILHFTKEDWDRKEVLSVIKRVSRGR